MRYARTMVGAVLVVLAVGGGASGQPQDDPVASIQELLDRRAAAVRDGDAAAFLATIDPAAPAGFRDAQTRHFNGLQAMPLDGYSLRVDADSTGDLSPPGLSDRAYQGDRTFLPDTRQRYRIRGYDDRDAVDALWLTYVERDGEWLVGGSDDLAGVGLQSGSNLWDLGPVRLLPTEHFLVVSHPETARRADTLARLAEEAMVRLDEVWPHPWSRRIPIILPSSVDELETLLQTTFDLDNFVAFVAYGVDRDAPSGYETTAPRMFIQDRNLSAHSEEFQIETLVHELVHAATAPASGPFVDRWLHEGLADWAAVGRPLDEPAPRRSDGRLPDPFEFTTGGIETISGAYGESRSAISFLAATAGPDAPAELFTVVGAARRAAGSVDFHVGRGLEAVTGLDFAAFEKAWAER